MLHLARYFMFCEEQEETSYTISLVCILIPYIDIDIISWTLVSKKPGRRNEVNRTSSAMQQVRLWRNQLLAGQRASGEARGALWEKKDQTADAFKRQMRDLIYKIGTTLQPVFISRKLEQDLKPREWKPAIVNQVRVGNSLTCDLCDSDLICRLHSSTPSPTHYWT